MRNLKFLFYKLLFPFAIIHVRWIQYRYKYITTKKFNQHSNINLATLRLLQSKEEYYKSMFEPLGIFHPSCVVYPKYEKFLNWLFPRKDFDEWDLVVWYKEEAVIYYHNKIYTLYHKINKTKTFDNEKYKEEIIKHINTHARTFGHNI